MENKIIIQAEKINKSYGTKELEVNIIKDLDLKIYEGDFTVIMGPSGSGKSTLLYILCGLDNLTSGVISFDNEVINDLKENQMALFRKEKMGFVFQDPNLLDDFTVLENITIPAYTKKVSKERINQRALNLLNTLNIEKHKNKYPTQLSGGEKQRAAIARGLINKPKVLFADEPTGALNSNQSEAVLNLLAKINEEGQNIIMVTHDIKSAAFANRILYLKNGKISGELSLDKYKKEKIVEREEQVFDFLKSKGW